MGTVYIVKTWKIYRYTCITDKIYEKLNGWRQFPKISQAGVYGECMFFSKLKPSLMSKEDTWKIWREEKYLKCEQTFYCLLYSLVKKCFIMLVLNSIWTVHYFPQWTQYQILFSQVVLGCYKIFIHNLVKTKNKQKKLPEEVTNYETIVRKSIPIARRANTSKCSLLINKITGIKYR